MMRSWLETKSKVSSENHNWEISSLSSYKWAVKGCNERLGSEIWEALAEGEQAVKQQVTRSNLMISKNISMNGWSSMKQVGSGLLKQSLVWVLREING